MNEPKPPSRLDRWLGPPAAFKKMLLAFACFFVATYVLVLPEVRPNWQDILDGLTRLGITGGAFLAGLLLMAMSTYDMFRNVRLKAVQDSVLAVATAVLGFLIFDALRQLAKDPAAFLETFVTALAGLLVALAIESKVFASEAPRRRRRIPRSPRRRPRRSAG